MKCLFCELADSHQQRHSMPEDHALAVSDNFYAKPALGQFVEGYMLIITKRHYRTLSEISSNDFTELDRFQDRLSKILMQLYHSPILAFEHGCTNAQRRAGSCIDHAHMHLLPFRNDISGYLKSRFSFKVLRSTAELGPCSSRGVSYLYYEWGKGEKLVFEVDVNIPGQYLRRVVCEQLGQPDVWDWAAHPFRDRIRAFTAAYTAACRKGIGAAIQG